MSTVASPDYQIGASNSRYQAPFLGLVFFVIINGLMADFILWWTGNSSWNISPIVAVTALAACYLIRTSLPHSNRFYLLMGSILLLLMLLPSSLASWLGLFTISVIAIATNPQASRGYLLLIGLASAFIWKAVAFKIISGLILNVETAFIGGILGLFREGIIVQGNIIHITADHALAMGLWCSVFSNLSFVILGWFSLQFLLDHNPRPLFSVLCLTLVLITFNTIRVLLMAIDINWYTFIHDGLGAQLYDMFLALIVASGLFSYTRAKNHV